MAEFLSSRPAGRPTLRELLASGEMVLAPGCYDALGARLVEEAGFAAVYMTGFGTAARRARPARRGPADADARWSTTRTASPQAVEFPVIADADTGYGNPLNVIRTVREYEARRRRRDPSRGPGRCPRSADTWRARRSSPLDEMAAKVRAAVAARAVRRLRSSSPAPTPARSRGSTPRSTRARRVPRGGRRRPVRRGAAVEEEIETIAAASPTYRCSSTRPRAARPRR